MPLSGTPIRLFLLLLAAFHMTEGFFLEKMFNFEDSCEGVCQLCTSCWMSGGQIGGYCGGLQVRTTLF